MEQKDVWAVGKAYDPYMGRWSRLIAHEFLSWLAIPASQRWLDVGCGTGALTQAVLETSSPDEVKGLDRSADFVSYAREQIQDERVSFTTGDAQALPFETGSFDVAVSGLALNFVPEPDRAVAEMTRVAQVGGKVAIYVWDYAEGMQMLRYFWEAADRLSPQASSVDERQRFAICRPEPLAALFKGAGLQGVEVQAIEIPTLFKNFDDFWLPFLGGQGPAASYVMSLGEADRNTFKEYLRTRLPVAPDGSIPLTARAWAAQGVKVKA